MTRESDAVRIEDRELTGPHGLLPVRIYHPAAAPGELGLVWAHGGSFIGGDLDAAESDWVARRLVEQGITVVAVDYRLAPVPEELVPVLGRRGGVHYPVPSEELSAAFAWAASGDGPAPGAIWMLGGASAGAALASGAALRLRDRGGAAPAGLVLAYPLLHYVIPEPDPDLASALEQLPPGERFLPGDVAAMNDNHLGPLAESDADYAFAGGKDLTGMPPTLLVASELDGLRPSAESFALELRAHRVDAQLEIEPETRHGHLATPDNPGAQRTIDRIVAWARSRPLEERTMHSVLSAAAAPTRLRIERREDGLGVGTSRPRLSWSIPGAPVGWTAATAQAEAVDGSGERVVATVGPRGVVEAWPFPPLSSGEARDVRVRVRGDDGLWTAWSDALRVEAGLLDSTDWRAHFIAAPWLEDTRVDQRPPLMRTEISIDGEVESARLRSTSLGVHELEIDGQRIGDELLSPGWSSYGHRLRYTTQDVTEQVRSAGRRLAIGAWIGDGWYRGRIGWDERIRNVWGDTLALLVQLEITYRDGRRQIIGTDSSWRAARGPITRSGIYDGERFDLRELPEGWSRPGFDDAAWEPVRLLPRPAAELVAYDGPPVRVIEEVRPQRIIRHDGGTHQFDFGQNLVGRLRLPASTMSPFGLRMRHAEVMQDGELSTRPLRTAEAFDTLSVATGPRTDETPSWSPRFTFHGFRYADVEGLPGDPSPEDVVAEVIHSDMRRTGWFRSSDPLLERLHENVVWSMRGNFVDVPTDCPQRDERLGWTGDLQVFAPTAAFLYDCSGLLRSWLRDVAAEQRPSGAIPHFVPDVPELDLEIGFTAIWGDVAALTPWDLYEAFGDRGMLAEQYPTARRWVEGLRSAADADGLITGEFQFGDWLDPSAPVDNALAAKADSNLLATAYYQRSAAILARAAAAIGETDDAREYAELAERVRVAFLDRFSPAPGVLSDDAQASYAVAIRFGLFGDDETARLAGARLAELVRERGHLIGTGFAGTPAICHALADTGHLDDAYAMLMQTQSPSWLYPVTQGATTIWERWDSLTPNGRVNDAGMTSFNHYALGAVADFLHRTVAGIAPAAPGYERILFRPRPGGGLESAGATLETPFGRASIDWRLTAEGCRVDVVVPVGASATLDLRAVGGDVRELGHGSHSAVVDLVAV
ncbi:hypothetical protein GCM10027515_04520 [Schumannella luteola]|uniref:alpha-L-rhamnosidase n=1 Tax=Schumannella luteola TaxID=472059 RepID=A0A852Y972_9MICO|nr:family 78 glycoside hydrolase catalytic domain [Schumannella luteola]NYG98412.1 alpha-L-rhamnosidase [Schumannella luteola]TPX01351.1 Bacterial alpha-L-rhamnosidase [Schumannella luteola]